MLINYFMIYCFIICINAIFILVLCYTFLCLYILYIHTQTSAECVCMCMYIQYVPLTTEPGISLIIFPCCNN
jgi:hypothetical protein